MCFSGLLCVWCSLYLAYIHAISLAHSCTVFFFAFARTHTRAQPYKSTCRSVLVYSPHRSVCVCVWVRAQLSKCLVYFFIHTCDGNLSSYLNQSEMWNVRVQCQRDNNSSNRIKANMKWIHRACIQRRIFPLQRGTFNSFYTVFRWNSIWKLELTKYDMMREQFYRISHFIEGFPIKSLSNLNLFF